MHDSVSKSLAPTITGDATATLFLWRGAGIVLLGAREADRWVLARGWLHGDRLEHIRRWSFAQPISFSGQIRRLVMEATSDFSLARAEGMRALAWSEAIS